MRKSDKINTKGDKLTAAKAKQLKGKKFKLPADDLIVAGLTNEELTEKIIQYLRERKNKK